MQPKFNISDCTTADHQKKKEVVLDEATFGVCIERELDNVRACATFWFRSLMGQMQELASAHVVW